MRRLGIDVGGTNTDAVLLDGDRVVAAAKLPTSDDLDAGVVAAVQAVLERPEVDPAGLQAVMVGTTQFTNAVVERARLERAAIVRVGLPASASLPPAVDWPADLRAVVDPLVLQVRGGHEYDGRPLVPLDRAGVRAAARRIADAGITAVAVSAIFSPLTDEAEREVAEILRDEIAEVSVTCSSDLGRIGLLERENVALLNASLRALGRRTVAAFESALAAAGLDVPTYLTQNDGTVVRASTAAENPVQGFASGPTNSMRGAAALAGVQDALVVDVGGTTSDVGQLRAGFPRQANGVIEVGGVRTLFRMPALVPIGLGGGSIVDGETGTVGPRSVGHRITQEALVFGGATTTATDVAVAAGLVAVGDVTAVGSLEPASVQAHLVHMRAMVQEAVDQSRTSAAELDLVAAGGGAFLVPDDLDGVREVRRVPHAEVANAVGAAMAQVSGEVDQVFSGTDRTTAVDAALALAHERAEAEGADPSTIEVVEVEDLPLAYVPGGARRVRARVVGDLVLPEVALR